MTKNTVYANKEEIEKAGGELSLQAQIYNAVSTIPDKLVLPDKSNEGARVATYATWKRIAQIAEKKAESSLALLIEDGIIKDPKSKDVAGEHELGKAGSLTVKLNVSVPRREFNFDWFAKKLLKEYKVPTVATRAYMEDAKQSGSVQTRTISVIDKAGAKV